MRASLRPCLLTAVFLTACTLNSPGLSPPGPRSVPCSSTAVTDPLHSARCQAFYFPAALALAHSGDTLYVASSNFDLRYNGATVVALDPEAIAESVRDDSRVGTCGAIRCIPDASAFGIEEDEIYAGSYISGMGISADDQRLYMSMRAEGSLTWIDLHEDPATHAVTMQCWGEDDGTRICDQTHRHGDDTYANTRGLVLPGDPVRLRVVPLSLFDPTLTGDATLLADRTGVVTLFFDDRGATAIGPQPISVLTGLHGTVAALGFDPLTQRAWVGSGYDPAAPSTLLSRVGVSIDPFLPRSYIYDAGKVPVAGVNDGTDVRDIVFDERAGNRRMYVLTRAPQAVIIADLAVPPDLAGTLPIVDIVPVDLGPSRLEFAMVGAVHGLGGRAMLFASCFDARTVNVIDADTGELITVVRGLGGPFDLAVDEERSLLYVTDFRSSTLRVVDLTPLVPSLTSPAPAGALDGELTVTSIGNPTPPQALM